MNRAAFFAGIRPMFGRSLSQAQVDGITGLLDAFETHGDGRADTLAYGLATAHHETGGRMVPVREGFATTDAGARAAVAKLAAKRGAGSAPAFYGKSTPPFGHAYYGRGHVQLTWLDNYRKSSDDAGTDLVRFPDAMLNPATSARVLWRGLLDGRWNGQKHGLRHYLDRGDVVGARRTVNGTDRAHDIAALHRKYLTAILAAGKAPTEPPRPDVEPPEPPVAKPDWAALLVKFITSLFGARK